MPIFNAYDLYHMFHVQEFDPDEFYHLLEEAEGVVREQLGSGNARVPDLPQYIIGMLLFYS